MSYPYTSKNCFDLPNTYMYTPFDGEYFLDSYIEDRRLRLARLTMKGNCSHPRGSNKPLADAALATASTERPDVFSPVEPIRLKHLLEALLGVLANGDYAAALPWLERVIQRFEVSKKLYAEYMPGFRKGKGEARDLTLYVEFALCMALAYELSKHLQYLSTLLKLNDILLSLDKGLLHAPFLINRLELLVVTELDAVIALATSQGVFIDG